MCEFKEYPELELTDYKSIKKVCLPTRCLNVFIGANGVGKTNLVEAVVLATCVEAEGSYKIPDCLRLYDTPRYEEGVDMLEDVRKWGRETYLHNHIYTLEERAIRLFSEKKRIEMRIPGVVYQEQGCENSLVSNGANIYEVLVGIEQTQPEEWFELQSQLGVIFGDWFESIELCEPIEESTSRFKRVDQEKVLIKFHRSDIEGEFYTRHSVSSGFLKVLAMLSLLFSKETPKVIAIENFGEGLNPGLSCYLVGLVASLAKRYGRQVFLTTHDVSVLDGIDIVREFLFVVSKDSDSNTRVKRIKMEMLSEKRVSKLSETWLRGSLGAMPKTFSGYYYAYADS